MSPDARRWLDWSTASDFSQDCGQNRATSNDQGVLQQSRQPWVICCTLESRDVRLRRSHLRGNLGLGHALTLSFLCELTDE